MSYLLTDGRPRDQQRGWTKGQRQTPFSNFYVNCVGLTPMALQRMRLGTSHSSRPRNSGAFMRETPVIQRFVRGVSIQALCEKQRGKNR